MSSGRRQLSTRAAINLIMFQSELICSQVFVKTEAGSNAIDFIG